MKMLKQKNMKIASSGVEYRVVGHRKARRRGSSGGRKARLWGSKSVSGGRNVCLSVIIYVYIYIYIYIYVHAYLSTDSLTGSLTYLPTGWRTPATFLTFSKNFLSVQRLS